MTITWPIGQQKRRYWRLGDDEYKVISGRVLLGERVSILRYGFIGDTLFYDVQVIGGKKSAILNSNCIRNMAFLDLAVQPSLASCAYSSIAPVVPLPAATSHVVPPSPPPPSASNARSSGIRLRSGQPLQPVIIKPRTSGTGPGTRELTVRAHPVTQTSDSVRQDRSLCPQSLQRWNPKNVLCLPLCHRPTPPPESVRTHRSNCP